MQNPLENARTLGESRGARRGGWDEANEKKKKEKERKKQKSGGGNSAFWLLAELRPVYLRDGESKYN